MTNNDLVQIVGKEVSVVDAVHQLGSVSEQGSGVKNPALLYIMSSESKHTLTTRKSIVSKLCHYLGSADLYTCPWASIRREHVFAILAKARADGLGVDSLRGYLSAIKGIAKEAWLSKLMPDGEYGRIQAVKSPRKHRIPSGRIITGEEIKRLIDTACGSGKDSGVRDAAIIAIARGAGLRRSELCSISMEQYTPETDQELASIKLIGKGNKERIVPLPPLVNDYLNEWFSVRGEGPGAIFCAINKGGALKKNDAGQVAELTPYGLFGIIESLALKAGIFDRTTPHDFRKTFATSLLDADVDIGSVQELLGHANIDTTKIYDLRAQKRLNKIAEKVEIFSS